MNPTIATHIPVTEEIPEEAAELAVGRPDAPTPSLWQRAVRVKRKVDGKTAVVQRVDWYTNMFRAFYPDEGEIGENGKPAGRFSERTEWEHCANWDVEVTFSPSELERQAAARALQDEMSKLNAAEIGLVSVLCDDPDPAKALAKLHAMRNAKLIGGGVDALAAAVDEVRAAPVAKVRRVPKPVEPASE